ncbi:MAG: hypothetical protein ACFFE8_07560 [Candidatus Heimdallarchaeota archaeon]
MKKTSFLLLRVFVFTLVLWNAPILSAGTNVNTNSFEGTLAGTNEKNVGIVGVVQTGPTIAITLEYDLNTTSQLESNELLAVLVVLGIQENPFVIKAAMLFMQTVDGQYHLFWMLGDPYRHAQNWQTGNENEHFTVKNERLTLFFIEFSDINNQNLETTVLAQITTDFEPNQQTPDFRIILDQFIGRLPISYLSGFYPATSTTSLESPNVSSGFPIISTIGVFLLVLLLKKFKRKSRP